MNYDEKVKRGADSPLRLYVENGELVIKIGINRLNGNDYHPTIPTLKFEDITEWAKDVMYELMREEEDGSSPISDLIDNAMISAMENGSMGLAIDSPTHTGECDICGEYCMPLRHTKNGQTCPECSELKVQNENK